MARRRRDCVRGERRRAMVRAMDRGRYYRHCAVNDREVLSSTHNTLYFSVGEIVGSRAGTLLMSTMRCER
jgi:hypothetical protein